MGKKVGGFGVSKKFGGFLPHQPLLDDCMFTSRSPGLFLNMGSGGSKIQSGTQFFWQIYFVPKTSLFAFLGFTRAVVGSISKIGQFFDHLYEPGCLYVGPIFGQKMLLKKKFPLKIFQPQNILRLAFPESVRTVVGSICRNGQVLGFGQNECKVKGPR